MEYETIDRGIVMDDGNRKHLARAIEAGLNRHAQSIRLVRIRLVPAGSRVRCRMRAWCGPGPTVVVSSARPSIGEAVDSAVATLERAIRRRKERQVASELKAARRIGGNAAAEGREPR